MEELIPVVTIESATKAEIHYMTHSDLVEMLQTQSLVEQMLEAVTADPTLVRRSNA